MLSEIVAGDAVPFGLSVVQHAEATQLEHLSCIIHIRGGRGITGYTI